MNTIFACFTLLILVGINGIFYLAGCKCFDSMMKANDLHWQIFSACYSIMSFGVAGIITLGIITLTKTIF